MLAFIVAERRHEVAVRMVLGAQRTDVLRRLLLEGAKMAAAGVALGIVASLALSRATSGLLFGIKPIDLATFVEMTILLFAVALAACYLPARRAALHIDPMVALHYE